MTLQIEPIGTVIGGRTEITDDYWGGIESIIRLDLKFPIDVVNNG
ncbi:hypothetical protein [Streptomyces liliiviolaceus]|nr:hypothetical protein [Streptomyces liliiviolaceus]